MTGSAEIIKKWLRGKQIDKDAGIHVEDEDNHECEHGYPDGLCPYCAENDEGDERYHALKDDGLLGHDFQNKDGKSVGYYDDPDKADSMHDEDVEPEWGQEWGK